MVKKIIVWYVVFITWQAAQAPKKFFKKYFFLKLKFEIDFLDLHVRGKLQVILFWLIRWKLWKF